MLSGSKNPALDKDHPTLVPTSSTGAKKLLVGGIDEANKGQCLNPLVVVCVYASVKNQLLVPYLGDSKSRKYTSEQLKAILKKYKLGYKLLQIPVWYVDRYNINTLLLRAQAHLIKTIGLHKVFVDSHFQKPALLKKEIQKNIAPGSCQIQCAHKMDGIHALTGLASLIAYQKKNKNLQALSLQLGEPVGSGNLADPVTKEYIKKYYPAVPNLRRSWDLKSLFKDYNTGVTRKKKF